MVCSRDHFFILRKKNRTFNLLTADVQQRFGVEAHCGHRGDHVLGIGEAELVGH